MKKMRLLAGVLAFAMTIAVAGCGGNSAQNQTATKASETEAAESAESESAAETAASDASESAEMSETGSSSAEEGSAEGAVKITDMSGREISLDAPASKIVALTPSDCEILYAIGAGDTLVGRGEFCDYPAEVVDVVSVESGYETNIEQIIELEPEVVLMATMAQPKEQVDALEAAGIKVVVSDAKDIEGVYTAIEMIGAVTGHDEEAARLVSDMKSGFDELRQSAKGDGSESIYFEVSPLEYGLWTAGGGTFMNEVAEMIGLKNCFEDLEGWAEVSQEQVIERAPDYIMTITMYYGEGPTPEEEIMSREGWENIPAVMNGRILNLADNELSRPGPRLLDGAKMLYEFIYEDEALAPAA